MNSEIGCGSNTSNDKEEGVERIKSDHQHWVEGEIGLDRRGYQVQERQHGKDGHEHVVVHNGRVARESSRNHVSDQSHDEKSPEELETDQFVIHKNH